MLSDNFEQFIAAKQLFTHNDRILLAVSGGVDSMVMLALFVRCGYKVAVAHCNFCLRGAESDKDEALVRATAEKYGLELHCTHFDTRAEMAARRLRYAWFEQLRREHNYTVVAVAHHADDAAETFFINLLRGTGLRGLTGISARVGHIVRPMLFASRADILAYAADEEIAFREDASNHSREYLRNRIRLDIVPRLREINPDFTALMSRNFARLEAVQRFIDGCIDRIRAQAVTSAGDIDTIHTDLIDKSLPQKFVLYSLLNAGYGFKGKTVDELCCALANGRTGRRFYAGGYIASIDRGNIVIAPIVPTEGQAILQYEYLTRDEITETKTPPHIALLDADKLQFPLVLRHWQEGDRFVPFGMKGHKKVSDFLIDAKRSLPEKERQEVLLSGDEIVWVVGLRIDERYRITHETKNVLRITQNLPPAEDCTVLLCKTEK